MFIPNSQKRRVLVACLDWGLGHASRCVPIVKALEKQGHQIVLASDGAALRLLKKEFPYLRHIALSPYNITYKYGNFFWSFLAQVPKILLNMRRERKQLQKIIKNEGIEVIISDNRFGLYSDKVPAIFLSHQIFLRMPKYLRWLEGFVLDTYQWWILDQFDLCWIPDLEGKVNLSGELSHKKKLEKKYRFIGPLSRFQRQNRIPFKRDILVLLSGPEPQRSILEQEILRQLNLLDHSVLIVRGITKTNEVSQPTPKITIADHLFGEALEEAILTSEWIIARSGYSSIMDLIALNKKAILIPTPGQTEQEYLGEYLMGIKCFYAMSQEKLDLVTALQEAEAYDPANLGLQFNVQLLNNAIREMPNTKK